MNNAEFKSKVMKCLMSKIEDLTNSNYSKINKNKTIRLRDLSGLIRIFSDSDFIECDKLEVDSYFLIHPSGNKISPKIYFTKDIYDLDINIATVKIAGDFLLYYTGAFQYKELKQLSYIYLYLLHLNLIGTNMSYYSQCYRNKLYNRILELDPSIIQIYDINFGKDKTNYYKNFAIKNKDNFISPVANFKLTEFSDGKILYYDTLYAHVTEQYGMNLMFSIGGNRNLFNIIKPAFINIQFNEYLKYIKNLEIKDNACFDNSYRIEKREYIDDNYNAIKNREIIKSLKEQYEIVKALEA